MDALFFLLAIAIFAASCFAIVLGAGLLIAVPCWIYDRLRR